MTWSGMTLLTAGFEASWVTWLDETVADTAFSTV